MMTCRSSRKGSRRNKVESPKRALKKLLVIAGAIISLTLALVFFIYPATVLTLVIFDSALQKSGQARLTATWFTSTAHRYERWAEDFLAEQRAAATDPDHVAGTEWPMFGSVFLLLTAEELQRQGQIEAAHGDLRQAVDLARAVVIAPETATWVKAKWGDGYLEKENIFYRMLLLMGLTSYARITGDLQDRDLISRQRESMAEELRQAPYHVRDDYPGECYPVDVLWAVAALQRAAELEGTNHQALADQLIAAYDGPLKAPDGLPAYQVDAPTGYRLQSSRGCGNSGLLLFASDLNHDSAARWYQAYASNFWKDTGWLAGFTEMPREANTSLSDVDSGIVINGIGSVASAFGIGAAKRAGRLDHVLTLTREAVACSWPTPFGFLTPGLLGKFAVDGWCLGELALLFSMTRPLGTPPAYAVPSTPGMPGVVWLLWAFYTGGGAWFVVREVRHLRRQRAHPRFID